MLQVQSDSNRRVSFEFVTIAEDGNDRPSFPDVRYAHRWSDIKNIDIQKPDDK